MKARKTFFVTVTLCFALFSCTKGNGGTPTVSSGPEVVFTAKVKDSYGTKAAEVTALSSFNVIAVIKAGERLAWGPQAFSGSTEFTGGKVWPITDPGWRFIASNAPLSFGSNGVTVAASNSLDVIVATSDNPAYAQKNTLTFHHILGRIGNVVIKPDTGYSDADITDVSVTITPKTGGTYNVRTESWSDVSPGGSMEIGRTTPGTQSNDIYLVPGDYPVSVSWRARGKLYGDSGSITVAAGKTHAVTFSLGGVLTAGVSIGTDVITWEN